MLVALYHNTMTKNIWTGKGQTGSSANAPDSIQTTYGKYFYTATTINQLHLHMYRILFRIPIQNISWLIKWSDLCGVGSWERLMHTPCLSLVWKIFALNIIFEYHKYDNWIKLAYDCNPFEKKITSSISWVYFSIVVWVKYFVEWCVVCILFELQNC
jgi:hypothetical protein